MIITPLPPSLAYTTLQQLDDLKSDNESIDTPFVSPFLDLDDELDDGEVLNELDEYGNMGNFYPNRIINSMDGDDLAFQSFGRHLEEIHVSWTQFGKKQDKIATLHEDDQNMAHSSEARRRFYGLTASQLKSDAVTINSFSLSLHVWYLDDGTIIGDTFVVGKEELRSRLAGVFLPNTARPLHGVKLLGGPVSVDFNFSSELMAQSGFDADLRTTLERIVTTYGHGFANSQWRLATLPFSFGGLGMYFSGLAFNDALCKFNTKIEDDLLSNENHIVSCADIIGIKYRHIVVRDTLVDICFRSGISAVKEVDIGLGRGCDKPLHHVDLLLALWEEGLDVCVDLIGSSLLI
ncbi:hypothetical protein Tco_1438587 [Tanacetum coccineum]